MRWRAYTPNANANGPDTVTYKANDGTVDSANATVSVTITPVNDLPTCAGTSVTTNEDTASAPFSLNCTDADGDALTCSVVTQGANGTVAVTSCTSAVYTPNANANGADVFTYQATDGTLPSLPATGTVTINAVNDAPACPDASATVLEDSPANPIVLPGCADPRLARHSDVRARDAAGERQRDSRDMPGGDVHAERELLRERFFHRIAGRITACRRRRMRAGERDGHLLAGRAVVRGDSGDDERRHCERAVLSEL